MVEAGQLKASDAAVVDVKFIGGQLIFDSAKTMTIWTDTTAGDAVPFKVEAQNASTALAQLGLTTLTANTDGTQQFGTKLTSVSGDAVAKKEFEAGAANVSLSGETIALGAGHGLKTGDAVVYDSGEGTAIGGLTKGTTYYVIASGTSTVKLATTAANATAGTAIDLTTAGSGTQSLTLAKSAPVSGGGSLGIGASVALDISNMTVTAEIADNAVVSGANDVLLSADSVTGSKVTSTAGGEAKGGSGVGIGGAVSIAVTNAETQALIGSGSALTLGGDLSATATHKGAVATKADGAASGGSAAVGIALALNVVNDSTLATTAREITAGGDVTFAAHASAATAADAKASAAGAEEEKADTPQDGVDKQVGAQRGLADKKAAEGGTTGTGTTTTPSAETNEGGVSVAAAVGVNIAASTAQAYIPASGKVTAAGY
jgi:hypothetical protein